MTHKHVPLNEFTAMRLAELAGVSIPHIRLVEMAKLEELPAINLPNEHYAFAIRRFDRQDGERIHMEDFAQILVKYPQDKYRSANYRQIGKILFDYAEDGLGKDKDWYKASMAQFEYWAGKAAIPWRAIRPHLLDTLDKARSLWSKALKDLPMEDVHKAGLREHWRNLHPDFRI